MSEAETRAELISSVIRILPAVAALNPPVLHHAFRDELSGNRASMIDQLVGSVEWSHDET